MDEAVFESGGAGMQAPIPSSRGQEGEQTVSGMAGLAHNPGRFAGEASAVCVLHGGEWGTDDLCSCVNHALQGFPAVFSAAPAPHGDAAEQDALNGASVECAHD